MLTAHNVAEFVRRAGITVQRAGYCTTSGPSMSTVSVRHLDEFWKVKKKSQKTNPLFFLSFHEYWGNKEWRKSDFWNLAQLSFFFFFSEQKLCDIVLHQLKPLFLGSCIAFSLLFRNSLAKDLTSTFLCKQNQWKTKWNKHGNLELKANKKTDCKLIKKKRKFKTVLNSKLKEVVENLKYFFSANLCI